MSDRRTLLKALAATSVLSAAGTPAAAAAVPARSGSGPAAAAGVPGIVKPLPPEHFVLRGTNAEARYETFRDTGLLTPADRFFVRNHTSTPVLDARDWRLTVWGDGLHGRKPVHFTYGQLRDLFPVTRTALIECAGNGRSLYTTQQGEPVSGTSWTLGAVGAARWRGARLSDLLRAAGLAPDAVDVMPRGLDDPYVTEGVDLGRVRRPLPVAKALDDVILAYEMNGEPLPYDHGFPVRLVVPAWVGIASIKWLGDIQVSRTPLSSPWSTDYYRLFGAAHPPGGSAPITRQTLKSAYELPFGATLEADRTHRLEGRAWSAHASVRKVEVSTDGGAHWRPARIVDRPAPDRWVRWTTQWRPRGTGPATLLSRVTDAAGNVQPERAVHNTQGYLFGAVVRHPVSVV
ncbi:sulfite oxidase [Streptomyces roseicoloratus]|uniref:Sulfite oxidase n=1 Tax=Streptomyces roseicoloratus TaxID=2508722 RepID=A0ABY9RSK3_9ACTN|nr:sulfite oxidase [Streptomyces roseicoloratus]WMX44219.1 sulfite oxidase [Streptomyces roseicoloratus]